MNRPQGELTIPAVNGKIILVTLVVFLAEDNWKQAFYGTCFQPVLLLFLLLSEKVCLEKKL